MTDSGGIRNFLEVYQKSRNHEASEKKMSAKFLQYEKDEYLCIKGIVMAIIAC